MTPGDFPTPSNTPRVKPGPWREGSLQDYWLLTQSQVDWLHPFDLLGKVTTFAEFRTTLAACTDYLSKDAARGSPTPDRILRSERFRACSSLDEASFLAELESWRWHRRDWFALKQVIEGACADGVLTIGERQMILERSRASSFTDEEILVWIISRWPDLQQQPSQGGGRIQRRVEGLLDEAERLETARDYAGAITLYDEVLALMPGHGEAMTLRESARRLSGALAKPARPSRQPIVPPTNPVVPSQAVQPPHQGIVTAASKDPIYDQLNPALDELLACYEGTELPEPLDELRNLIEAQAYDQVKTRLSSIWQNLVKYHRENGLRIRKQVTTAFNTIMNIVKTSTHGAD